jgi:hypothetical protein
MKAILSFLSRVAHLSPRSGIYRPSGPLSPRSGFIARRAFIARSAFILLIALAISGCRKYDDSNIWDELLALNAEQEDQNARLAALEAWVDNVNSNIEGLQGLVNALQQHRYISAVTPYTDPAPGGYLITFADQRSPNPINLHNGNKGDTGDTGAQGEKGNDGKNGEDGKKGTDGADGAKGKDGTDGNDGKNGADGKNGEDGKNGADGTNGKDGADGATPQIGVKEYPDDSGIYYWTLNGDWLYDKVSGEKIPVTGPKGDPGSDGNDGTDGNNGADGKTPMVAIGSDGYWYICASGACTNTPPATGWENTYVKATGNDGEDGKDGKPGEDGNNGNDGASPKVIIGTDGYWYICPSGTCTGTPDYNGSGGWEKTGTKATGDKGDKGDDGDDGRDGRDGKDGKDGKDGNDGTDGKTPRLAIGTDGIWYVCPDGNCVGGLPPAAEGWLSTGVSATGPQGEPGSDGDAIFSGIDNAHDDYVEFTLADDDDNPDNNVKIKVPKYRPLSIEFTPPGELALEQEVNIKYISTGNVQTITAVDVPRGWTVTVNTASNVITVTTPAVTSTHYRAAGTATLLVSDGTERTITKPLPLSCSSQAYEPPPGAPNIEFAQPGEFALRGGMPITLTKVTESVTSITAENVPEGWTVDLHYWGPSAGSYIPDMGPFIGVIAPSGESPYTAAGTVTLQVSDGEGNTTSKKLLLRCPEQVTQPPVEPGAPNIEFAQPGAFQLGQNVQIMLTTVEGNITSITPIDVPLGWSLDLSQCGAWADGYNGDWVSYVGSPFIQVAAPNGSTAYTATGTVTLLVSDGEGKVTPKLLQLQCPAPLSAGPLGIEFAQPAEPVVMRQSIAVPFTFSGDGAEIKVIAPAGWTIGVGMNSYEGTGTFHVTATQEAVSRGEALVYVSDASGETVMKILNLAVLYAKTNRTFEFAGLIWSDVITVPSCDKVSFTETLDTPQCRSFTDADNQNTFFYYNEQYVWSNPGTLCPSPWRVPLQQELAALYSNNLNADVIAVWGTGGYATAAGISGLTEAIYLRSNNNHYNQESWTLWMKANGEEGTGYFPVKGGVRVVCVRNK